MNLNLVRRGRKFFFLTLCVDGRPAVLSKLEDDGTLTLTPDGERVVAYWRETHGRNPALTASNFVIMPDHVHLLLIVNYDVDPAFDLINWVHRFMESTVPPGGSGDHPRLVGPRLVGPRLVGPRLVGPRLADPRLAGSSWRWSRDYYLVLSFDSRQLKAIRRYIKLNPARKLWKQRHADMFVCHRDFKSALFSRLPPRRWDGLGNLTILGSPFLFHVRLTLKKTVEEHREAIDEIVERARRGEIPVSGFISPGEKEALRRLKAEPRASFVKLLPYALPPRYDPSAEDSRELAAGRLAIVSGFPDTPAIAAVEMRSNPAAARAFRQNCLAMNDIAAALCAAAQN